MTVRAILTYPDPRLRKKAQPVREFGPELARLAADMADTMYAAPGVGLAAPQIGVPLRVVVIDITPKEEGRDLKVLVNPRILDPEGEIIDTEGCLSVIEYSAKVKRAAKIRVEAQDLEGRPFSFVAEEWFARVVQHEVDHLDGILYIDRISRLKRSMYEKKLKKILREQERAGSR